MPTPPNPPNSTPTPTPPTTAIQPQLRRLAYQYLLHNFLYNRLQQPLISDPAYDQIARKLWQLHQLHPKITLPYQKILKKSLGPEASAFNIVNYPPPIITTALKLLYQQSSPPVDFREFVERLGCQIQYNSLPPPPKLD